MIFSLVLRKTLISFLLLHPYLYNRQSNQIIFIWNLMFHYNQGRKSRPNKYVLVESKYWKKIVVEATNFQHLTWKWRCRLGDELLGSMSHLIKRFWNKVRLLKKQQARILSKTWIFRPCINDKSVHKVFVYKLFLASSNVKARQDDQSSYLQQCLLLLGFLTHFSISNHFSLTKKIRIWQQNWHPPQRLCFCTWCAVRTFKLCAPVPKVRYPY